MTEKQRDNKISHFMKAEIEPGNADSEEDISQTSQSTPLDSLVLPPHLKKTIWMNANSIFVDSAAIVQAPGDSTAYIVKSLSGQKPHYVQPSKGGGGFLCDNKCLGYKSAKICAHTVSAALKADDIEAYVCWYKRLKCKPNFTVLAESGKPSTSGKKPRKGATKKVSKHIHSIVENASELQFKNRTQVNQSASTSTAHVQSTECSNTPSPSGSFVPQLSEASVQLAQKPANNGSDSISQSSTQPSILDATPLLIFTAMQAPFYNYGFQSLGQ